MMRLRERDRIVWPQTIQSPTTTMSNDKVDQWMQSAATLSAGSSLREDASSSSAPATETPTLAPPLPAGGATMPPPTGQSVTLYQARHEP